LSCGGGSFPCFCHFPKAPIGWEVVQLAGLQTLESDSLIDKPFGTLQIYEIGIGFKLPLSLTHQFWCLSPARISGGNSKSQFFLRGMPYSSIVDNPPCFDQRCLVFQRLASNRYEIPKIGRTCSWLATSMSRAAGRQGPLSKTLEAVAQRDAAPGTSNTANRICDPKRRPCQRSV
jgi:hypothetical protein